MYKVKVNNDTFEIELHDDLVQVDGQPFEWDVSPTGDRSWHIIRNNKSYRAELIRTDPAKKLVTIKINGTKYDIEVKDKFDLLLEKLGMNTDPSSQITAIKAPMPGLILDIHVAEGDEVKAGTPLMILEAMKMENVIKAAGDGVVKSVKVKKGDSVEKNQVLIQF